MFNSNIRNVLCFKVFVWGPWELNMHFILYMNVHSQISSIILFFLIMFSLTYHVCFENHMFKKGTPVDNLQKLVLFYLLGSSVQFRSSVIRLGEKSPFLADDTNFVYASSFFGFEVGSPYVAQMALEFVTSLPSSPNCWDYSYAPLCLAIIIIIIVKRLKFIFKSNYTWILCTTFKCSNLFLLLKKRYRRWSESCYLIWQ